MWRLRVSPLLDDEQAWGISCVDIPVCHGWGDSCGLLCFNYACYILQGYQRIFDLPVLKRSLCWVLWVRCSLELCLIPFASTTVILGTWLLLGARLGKRYSLAMLPYLSSILLSFGETPIYALECRSGRQWPLGSCWSCPGNMFQVFHVLISQL